MCISDPATEAPIFRLHGCTPWLMSNFIVHSLNNAYDLLSRAASLLIPSNGIDNRPFVAMSSKNEIEPNTKDY
jgi:hypothetical protein